MSNFDLNELVIQLVQGRKCLYAKSKDYFRDTVQKKGAWIGVAEEITQITGKIIGCKYFLKFVL